MFSAGEGGGRGGGGREAASFQTQRFYKATISLPLYKFLPFFQCTKIAGYLGLNSVNQVLGDISRLVFTFFPSQIVSGAFPLHTVGFAD